MLKDRPPHVDRAINALMTVAARAGTVPFGDICEVRHYIARLERELHRKDERDSIVGRIFEWWQS